MVRIKEKMVWGEMTTWLRLGNNSGHVYMKPMLTVGRKQEAYSCLSFENEQWSPSL